MDELDQPVAEDPGSWQLEDIEQTDHLRHRPGHGFVLWWMIATAGGSISALASIAVISTVLPNIAHSSSPSTNLDMVLDISARAAILGFVLGLAQSFVFRRYLLNAFMWVLASFVGWYLIGVVGTYMEALFPDYVRQLTGVDLDAGIVPGVMWDISKALVGGLVIGSVQYIAFAVKYQEQACGFQPVGFAWLSASG